LLLAWIRRSPFQTPGEERVWRRFATVLPVLGHQRETTPSTCTLSLRRSSTSCSGTSHPDGSGRGRTQASRPDRRIRRSGVAATATPAPACEQESRLTAGCFCLREKEQRAPPWALSAALLGAPKPTLERAAGSLFSIRHGHGRHDMPQRARRHGPSTAPGYGRCLARQPPDYTRTTQALPGGSRSKLPIGSFGASSHASAASCSSSRTSSSLVCSNSSYQSPTA
jgi:hypothetical protein